MVAHQNHHVYMAHVLRGLYETYPDTFPKTVADPAAKPYLRRLHAIGENRHDLAAVFSVYDDAIVALGRDNPVFGHPGPFGRALVHKLDKIGLSTSAIKRHTAIAQTVADRPNYFPRDAMVWVIHPPTDLRLISGLGNGRYLFTASRLDAPKRIDLLIEAFRQTQIAVELRIAGSGPESDRLRELARGDERIIFLGFVADDDLPALYANAIAVPFVPEDEDYGLIALEALQSGTPVITTTDAGGPTELVTHAESGWIVKATAAALSEAMADACNDLARSRRMGAVGQNALAGINWESVSKQLVRPASAALGTTPRNQRHAVVRRKKRLLLSLNTFTVHKPQGGGQLRAFHLGKGLSNHFDVHLLSLSETNSQAGTQSSAPGLTETVIPRSASHAEYEGQMSSKVGIPVTDIYGGLGLHMTPAYTRELRTLAAGADAIVLSHPYLEPALEAAEVDLPVIYDAHNVEARLKDAMFPLGPDANQALRDVQRIEEAAIKRASLMSACSVEDKMMFEAVYGELPPTVVITNGADIDAVPFVCGQDRIKNRNRWLTSMGEDENRRVGVFLASWHQPNLDAATTLHEIAADTPRMLFLMVGSHCDYFRGTKVPGNVVQMGLVGNATKRVLLTMADVGLNPMATGSGTNLKMVEYLASGMVALSTPVGARGLPSAEGIFQVADLEDFGLEISQLIEIDHDDERRISQVRKARELVEAKFGWRRLADRFALAIEDTLF